MYRMPSFKSVFVIEIILTEYLKQLSDANVFDDVGC